MLPSRQALHVERKLFHFINGALLMVVFNQYLTPHDYVTLVGSFWVAQMAAEILRLRYARVNAWVTRAFRPVMRAHETRHFSGMLAYVFGTLLVAALFSKHVAIVSVMLLATCDPVAALVGNLARRFPRLDRRTRLRNGKSVLGAAAGMLVAGASAYRIFACCRPSPIGFIGRPAVLLLCAWLALAAALAELFIPTPQVTLPFKYFPLALDDNTMIPLVVALCYSTATVVLHFPSYSAVAPWILW